MPPTPDQDARRQPPLRTPQPSLRAESSVECRELEALHQIRREQRRQESQQQRARAAIKQESVRLHITKTRSTHEGHELLLEKQVRVLRVLCLRAFVKREAG